MGGRVDDLAVLESNPAVFYVGTATGGLWKTVNNGTTWTVLLRRPRRRRLDRRHRDQSQRRQHGVGRQRREQQPAERVVGQRHLQVHRRRRDVEAHGPAHLEAHRPHHRRSGRSRRRLRRGARQPVGPRRRARRLQDHRRRPDLDARAPCRRRHRRHRARDGSAEQQGDLRGDLSAPPRHLGLQRRRAGQRDVEVERRGPHLDQAHRRACRPVRSGASAWTSTAPTRTSSTRASSTRTRAAPIDRTTPACRGGRCRTSIRGRCTSARSGSIPTNDARIYVLGVQIAHLRRRRQDVHRERRDALRPSRDVDQPANSNHIIDGNDGGVGISYDKGETWEGIYNMDLGQFYHVTYDMETPYNVYGGLQDNYTWCGPERGAQPHRHRQRSVVLDPWRRRLRGADRPEELAHRSTPSRRTATSRASIAISNERKSIRPLPARGEPPLRWNWNTPILMSPHDSNTIYVGANKVFKSTDRGQTLDGDQPRPHRRDRSRRPDADGPDRARNSRSPRTTACSRTATSCSWSNRRSRPACSTPAPTTARCT